MKIVVSIAVICVAVILVIGFVYTFIRDNRNLIRGVFVSVSEPISRYTGDNTILKEEMLFTVDNQSGREIVLTEIWIRSADRLNIPLPQPTDFQSMRLKNEEKHRFSLDIRCVRDKLPNRDYIWTHLVIVDHHAHSYETIIPELTNRQIMDSCSN